MPVLVMRRPRQTGKLPRRPARFVQAAGTGHVLEGLIGQAERTPESCTRGQAPPQLDAAAELLKPADCRGEERVRLVWPALRSQDLRLRPVPAFQPVPRARPLDPRQMLPDELAGIAHPSG